MMMNLEGFGRKRSASNCKILSRHLPGETEENNEKPQSGWPIAGAEIQTRVVPNMKEES
jgi:hypothetical protein